MDACAPVCAPQAFSDVRACSDRCVTQNCVCCVLCVCGAAGVRACYDEGKRVAETLFFDFHRQHKIEVRVARIFNTFGPGMHPYGEKTRQDNGVENKKSSVATLIFPALIVHVCMRVPPLPLILREIMFCLNAKSTACTARGGCFLSIPRQDKRREGRDAPRNHRRYVGFEGYNRGVG